MSLSSLNFIKQNTINCLKKKRVLSLIHFLSKKSALRITLFSFLLSILLLNNKSSTEYILKVE